MAKEHDPYGILPDGFCETFGEDTIPEALAAAERAPSSTDYSTMDRCPNPQCESVRIRTKAGSASDIPHRKDDKKYKCTQCSTHFNEPAPASTIPLSDGRTNAFEWGVHDGLAADGGTDES